MPMSFSASSSSSGNSKFSTRFGERDDFAGDGDMCAALTLYELIPCKIGLNSFFSEADES